MSHVSSHQRPPHSSLRLLVICPSVRWVSMPGFWPVPYVTALVPGLAVVRQRAGRTLHLSNSLGWTPGNPDASIPASAQLETSRLPGRRSPRNQASFIQVPVRSHSVFVRRAPALRASSRRVARIALGAVALGVLLVTSSSRVSGTPTGYTFTTIAGLPSIGFTDATGPAAQFYQPNCQAPGHGRTREPRAGRAGVSRRKSC